MTKKGGFFMEEKEKIPGNKMAWNVVGWAILFSILLGILYSLIYGVLTSNTDNLIIAMIIAFILQALVSYFTWKMSISTAFKKKTISSTEVGNVVRGIFIYTILILVIYSISNILDANQGLEEISDSIFSYYDSFAESYLSDSGFISYQQQKQAIIEEVKSTLYGFLTILIVGNWIIYLVMAFVAKKMVLKYVVVEDDFVIKNNE